MISLERWLGSFGFVRNPFETTEAGSEADYATDFLHATFVKPEGFDRILGHPSHPKSSLVFASRGRGKSTARLMLAHFCQQGIFPIENIRDNFKVSRVLPIVHTQFTHLVQAIPNPPSLIDAHIIEILHRAIPILADMLIKYQDVAECVRSMDALRRLELQSFLVFYRTYIPFQVYRKVRDILGDELIQENLSDPIGFVHTDSSKSQIGLTAKEVEMLLASQGNASPANLLGRFADLLADIGIQALYILIDSLDEIFETADDPHVSASLIVPLLSNLTLMNSTPRVAFKVFAPAELSDIFLNTTQKVRRDRLDIMDIRLRELDLMEILQRRLNFCSNNTISSLDAVCVPEMRSRIDAEITRRAEGNPRRLILLGDYMIRARCEVVESENEPNAYSLTEKDLDSATLRMTAEFPLVSPISVVSDEDTAIEPLLLGQVVSRPQSDEWLRHELPAPLAVAYLAYIRERLPHARVWKLFDLVEAVSAYLSLILISLMYQKEGVGTAQRLERIDIDMRRTFMGRWRYATEILPGLCSGLKIKHRLVGGTQRLIQDHAKFLLAMNEERNHFAHDGPQPENVCEDLLAAYNSSLRGFLSGLYIINKGSHLVKVQEIIKQGPEFIHHCTLYKGDTLSFPHLDLTLATALDSQWLWLVGGTFPVNLHPLMLAQVAPGNLTEEVWLYQGVGDDLISYKSYGTGRTLDTKEYRQNISRILGI